MRAAADGNSNDELAREYKMEIIASAWKQVGNFFIANWWFIILICLIVFGYVFHKKLTNTWKKLIKQFVAEREQFTNSGK